MLAVGACLNFRPIRERFPDGGWGLIRFWFRVCPRFCLEFTVVRIRLQRMGRRHVPFYRINAVDKHTKRDGKVLENLGWYDPTAKDKDKQVLIKTDRVKAWLDKGAQPSDTMMDMLSKIGLVDAEAWGKVRAGRVEAKKKAEEKKAAAAAAGEKKPEKKEG